jgi:hypothetical protein
MSRKKMENQFIFKPDKKNLKKITRRYLHYKGVFITLLDNIVGISSRESSRLQKVHYLRPKEEHNDKNKLS